MTIKELLHLSASKLKRVVALKSQIERLEAQLGKLVSATSSATVEKVVHTRRKMSAAARKKISLAAKARWAKVRTKAPQKKKRTMSAAARRKIAAAAKARWAKAKASGKKHL